MSESHPPQLARHPISASLSSQLSDFFMDTGAHFAFRAYLGHSPPDDLGVDVLAEALISLTTASGSLSNAQLYDALHAQLCGPEPLEREALLKFLRLFTQALRQYLRLRADHSLGEYARKNPSNRNSFTSGSPTTLYVAEQFPRLTLDRLNAWESFLRNHRSAAEVYELSDFAGCTDAEIARLLDMTTDRVKELRVHASSIIWDGDGKNTSFLPQE